MMTKYPRASPCLPLFPYISFPAPNTEAPAIPLFSLSLLLAPCQATQSYSNLFKVNDFFPMLNIGKSPTTPEARLNKLSSQSDTFYHALQGMMTKSPESRMPPIPYTPFPAPAPNTEAPAIPLFRLPTLRPCYISLHKPI